MVAQGDAGLLKIRKRREPRKRKASNLRGYVLSVSTTTAIIGLASGVLGALLGGVLTVLSDHRRWKREDRQRWHERRLDAYATTLDRLTEVFATISSAIDLARPRVQPPWRPLRLRTGLRGSDRALREAREALFVTQLVGSSQAVEASEHCLAVIGALVDDVAELSRAVPNDQLEGHLKDLTSARDQLIVAARRELDVHGEE